MRIPASHTPTNQPFVSIVAPTYNEAGIAVKSLSTLTHLVDKHIPNSEIIVLDDGSTDGNLSQLQSFARGKKHLRIIPQNPNRGTAISFRNLYALAKGEWIISFSLDGEWDPADVIRLYERLSKDDSDMVLGVRTHKHYAPGRLLVSWVYNAIVFLLFGVATKDAGSIKAMRTKLVRNIPIVAKGVFDEAERIIRAARLGYRIAYLPISHLPTKRLQRKIPKPALILQALRDLMRVFLELNH